MKLTIDVEYADGHHEQLTAWPADFVAWERHTGRRMSDLGDAVGMEDLAYLAWSATRRNGGERPPFDVWLGRIADLDEAPDTDPPTPTHPAPQDVNSSS